MDLAKFHFRENWQAQDIAHFLPQQNDLAVDRPVFMSLIPSNHLIAINQAMLAILGAGSLSEAQIVLFGEDAKTNPKASKRLAYIAKTLENSQDTQTYTLILGTHERQLIELCCKAVEHTRGDKILLAIVNNAVAASNLVAEVPESDTISPSFVPRLVVNQTDKPLFANFDPLDTLVTAKIIRFVWRTDKDNCFTEIDAALVQLLGRATAPKLGQNFLTLVDDLALDPQGKLVALFEKRLIWTGVRLAWPIVGKIAPVILDFSGLPAFEGHNFAGYRGFALYDLQNQPQTAVLDETTEIPNIVSLPQRILRGLESVKDTQISDTQALEPSPSQEATKSQSEENKANDQAPAPTPAALNHDTQNQTDKTIGHSINGTASATFAKSNIISMMPFIVQKRHDDKMQPREDDTIDPNDVNADDETLAQKYAKQSGKTDDEPAPSASWPPQSFAGTAFQPDPYPATHDVSQDTQRGLSADEQKAFEELALALKKGGEAYDARESLHVQSQSAQPHSALIQSALFQDDLLERQAKQDRKLRRLISAETIRDAASLIADSSLILDNLVHGVAVQRDGLCLYANQAMLDMLGFASLTGFNEAGGLDKFFDATPNPAEFNLPCLTKSDGSVIPVQVTMQTTSWANQPASLFTFSKITKGVQLDHIKTLEHEARTRNSEARELDAILDTATDGVLVLDEAGTILSLNRSGEALFGVDQNEVVGEPITQLFASQSHPIILDYLTLLKSGGVASLLNDGREVLGLERQGRQIPLFMTLGEVSRQPVHKFCAVLRDQTQWKQAESELKAARQNAEEASLHKSAFLAKISHEVRTPLNAILGFTEVIMEERFGPVGTPRYKDYLKDIHRSGLHVISLVNDLLDLSKIEAGKMDITFVDVDANKIVQECVQLMQPQANRERIIMRLSLAPRLPKIRADERSLRQIVLNLLSNAVKFNEPGGQVIVSSALSDSGYAIIRVRDTGVGMSEADLQSAFEPFRQLDNSTRTDGTGLGLPLTKAMIEANQATMTIKSKVKEGTLIEVVFPPASVLTH